MPLIHFRNFKPRLFVAATAVVVSCALPAYADDQLKSVLTKVYENNPTLAVDRAGLRALDEDIAIARTGRRPTILAEGTVQRTEIDIENTGMVGGIRVVQPLFRGFQTRNAIRAARANVEAGRATLAQTENNILVDAAVAYVEVVAARESLALNKRLVEILEALKTAEETRLSKGERTKTDVAQSKARLADANAAVAIAGQVLSASEHGFRRLVGEAPNDDLPPIQNVPPLPPSREEAVSIAKGNSPFLQRLRSSEEAASHLVRQQRGQLYPTVSAQASLQHRDQVFELTGVDIEQTLGTVGVTVTVPIYQAGGVAAQVRRAKHVRELRRLELIEGRQTIITATETAWSTYQTARAARDANQLSVLANRVALDGVRVEALNGSRTTLDVLNAELEHNSAQLRLAAAERDRLIAAFDLLAILGRFTASNMGLDVELYDPSVNYEKGNDAWFSLGE
ncbi:MAG: TolC family outer membrane protein [Pseudomonadota bacterium]